MAFLSGSVGFERFKVTGPSFKHFNEEHIEALRHLAATPQVPSSAEPIRAGFIAGGHLLDTHFDFEKNIIDNALHCAVRVDTNQVPSALRRAWMQMELFELTKDSSTGRPTKAQRQEAKEAVDARCEAEAQTGKYHKMQEFPVLWDANEQLLYLASSSASAVTHSADLFSRAFDIELSRLSAGSLVNQWAEQQQMLDAIDDLTPATFVPGGPSADSVWLNEFSGNHDYLGNEFLLWLWWQTETHNDTIQLPDQTDVTVMFSKSLSLECPLGEAGKDTLSSICPVKLPEAMQAIRSGKLPRKAGLTLVRQNQQFDLSLQAETFGISGAKIQVDEAEDAGEMRTNRIDAIRNLGQTVDLLFQAFLARRVHKKWSSEVEQISRWLGVDKSNSKKPAA